MEAAPEGTQGHVFMRTLSKPPNRLPHTHTHNLLPSFNLWPDHVSLGV